jgi:hypothetical protein
MPQYGRHSRCRSMAGTHDAAVWQALTMPQYGRHSRCRSMAGTHDAAVWQVLTKFKMMPRKKEKRLAGLGTMSRGQSSSFRTKLASTGGKHIVHLSAWLSACDSDHQGKLLCEEMVYIEFQPPAWGCWARARLLYLELNKR